jgi:hypothetical protein
VVRSVGVEKQKKKREGRATKKKKKKLRRVEKDACVREIQDRPKITLFGGSPKGSAATRVVVALAFPG